jgi:hypothetical protein
MTITSYQGGGLSACGDSVHALSWTGGQFGCQSIPGAGDVLLASTQTFTGANTHLSSETFKAIVYISTSGHVGFDEYQNSTYVDKSTITWNNGNHQSVTLTANATFVFNAPSCPSGSANCEVPVSLRIATGSGGFTTSWPAAVLWKAGTAPTTTVTASKVDYVVCRYASITAKYYCDGTSQNF